MNEEFAVEFTGVETRSYHMSPNHESMVAGLLQTAFDQERDLVNDPPFDEARNLLERD
jgi:hypothetical protein